jgi:hypothetical protein
LVVTSYPLRVVLHNPNATGNIAKWAAELAEFELDFIVRHMIKSQVLSDFVVDWMPPPSHPGGGRQCTGVASSGVHRPSLDPLLRWLLT